MEALSDACFVTDADGKAKVTADFMKKATDAGKSEEDDRAELLGKKSAWWRSRTDATVPPPQQLGARLFEWFMQHCLTIDEASSVPLFTPKAVQSKRLRTSISASFVPQNGRAWSRCSRLEFGFQLNPALRATAL